MLLIKSIHNTTDVEKCGHDTVNAAISGIFPPNIQKLFRRLPSKKKAKLPVYHSFNLTLSRCLPLSSLVQSSPALPSHLSPRTHFTLPPFVQFRCHVILPSSKMSWPQAMATRLSHPSHSLAHGFTFGTRAQDTADLRKCLLNRGWMCDCLSHLESPHFTCVKQQEGGWG